ncbi:MAG: Bro-N domain-containing protein [bacterium]
MNKENSEVLFNQKTVRRHWDKDKEKWYFAIVDVISILTESSNPQVYWRVLKKRLTKEGSFQTVTNCNGFKMLAPDGKLRDTDVADTETLLRLIQSIPSPKAEPFKIWLAKVGYERMQEMRDPEVAFNRTREYWKRMGRSEKWIQQRMFGQEVRSNLTDYWSDHEVNEIDEFASLTNIIHKEWTDISVNEHKDLKGLNKENLRDHMSDTELIFTSLAELSTKQIAVSKSAIGFDENIDPAKSGGKIAKNARLELEAKTGNNVITGDNFLTNEKSEKILE